MTLDPLSRLRLCRKYTFEFRGTLDIELSTIWALHDFTDQLALLSARTSGRGTGSPSRRRQLERRCRRGRW